jgi:hypothetical protein
MVDFAQRPLLRSFKSFFCRVPSSTLVEDLGWLIRVVWKSESPRHVHLPAISAEVTVSVHCSSSNVNSLACCTLYLLSLVGGFSGLSDLLLAASISASAWLHYDPRMTTIDGKVRCAHERLSQTPSGVKP